MSWALSSFYPYSWTQSIIDVIRQRRPLFESSFIITHNCHARTSITTYDLTSWKSRSRPKTSTKGSSHFEHRWTSNKTRKLIKYHICIGIVTSTKTKSIEWEWGRLIYKYLTLVNNTPKMMSKVNWQGVLYYSKTNIIFCWFDWISCWRDWYIWR